MLLVLLDDLVVPPHYAGQPTQDYLLPTRLPDKARPKKDHGKASGRSYTDAEAAELAADQAEQRSRLTADQKLGPISQRPVVRISLCLIRCQRASPKEVQI